MERTYPVTVAGAAEDFPDAEPADEAPPSLFGPLYADNP